MAKIVILQNIFLLIWACAVLVCGSSFESLGFELTDICADINLDVFYSDHSDILDLRARDTVQNDDSNGLQSMLQEEQVLESSCGLDTPALSNGVNTVGINEDSSASASLSLPGTSTSSDSNTNSSPASSVSSVLVRSPAGSAKRACDTEVKEDGEQRRRKRQRTNTTSMGAETNTSLMDETEVCLAIEKFSGYFGKDTKANFRLTPDITEFSEDLGLRGLTSVHSKEIVELCTASEQWLEHNVFWRMLLFFVDTLSLEIVDLNQLEDKKTIVLRNRKIREKPLSECTDRHIRYVIAKFRGAVRMEIQCSLDVLESRGTADVLGVLRWLLYHINIRCVGVTCDLTEPGMSSKMFGRQMGTLTKERRGRRVCIDSLALHFTLPQYKDADVAVKECSWVTVLKMHFIDTDPQETGVINQALKTLLLHCSALEQLSIFGIRVGIEYIRTIAAMLPQLVLLEIGVLTLEKLALSQKEEEEFRLVFSGLKTLKLPKIYDYSCAGIESLVCLFPSLKYVQISAKNVTTPLIDALSSLRFLRFLEILNGLLPIETAEYLLDKLPSLECLSVGVKELDNKLVHVLSKYTGMHTLKLRGICIPGFLASLLQTSPLMNTLKALTVLRNSGFYRKGNFSAEDKHSKKAAMKKFGCAVEIRQ